jgi:hypothetical protein
MSFGLRWGEDNEEGGGFIWFDAITANVESYRGQVTRHPIANGGSVSDHFIRENPTITLSVVITGFDISQGSYLIQDLVGNSPYNVNEAPNAVQVNSTDQSVLTKFIPDSIGQFLADTSPEVIMDTQRLQVLDTVREYMINLMSGFIYSDAKQKFVPNIQTVRLFEYNKTLLKKIINNLVITNMVFKEDANSGEGLYCDLTFEQVTFASLKKTIVPKDITNSLKKKAAPKVSKGKQPAEVNDVTEDKGPEADKQRDIAAEL